MRRDIHIKTGRFLLLLPDFFLQVQVQLIEALIFLVHAVPLVVCVLGGVGPGLHGAVGVHQNGLWRQQLDKVTVSNKGVQCPPSLSATRAWVYKNQKVFFFFFGVTGEVDSSSDCWDRHDAGRLPSVHHQDGLPT